MEEPWTESFRIQWCAVIYKRYRHGTVVLYFDLDGEGRLADLLDGDGEVARYCLGLLLMPDPLHRLFPDPSLIVFEKPPSWLGY